jgi:hypothetical protein
MSYFQRLPNLEYEKKPFVFPFSETEYVLAKNFFKRFKVSDSSFNYNNFFTKYTLTDQDRIDYLAFKTYGSSELDWVILLTNNIINTHFNLPIKESYLYDIVNKEYVNSPGNQSVNPSDRVHHYETSEVKDSLGRVVLKAGLVVEKSFYDGEYKYFDDGDIVTVAGSNISNPVTNYEYELNLNNQKRSIYLLRPEFVQEFIDQFEKGMTYSKSSSYIDKKTKKSS